MRFLNLWRLPFLFIAFSVSALNAALSLQGGGVFWQGGEGRGYDVFSELEPMQEVPFQLLSDAGDEGSYFITFSSGQSSNYERKANCGIHFLRYQLYQSYSRSSILKEDPRSLNEAIVLNIGPERTLLSDLSYFISIPKGQVVPPGIYSDVWTMHLYQGTLADKREVSRLLVNFQISVLSSIDIQVESSLGGGHAPHFHQIDLGELNSRQVLTLDILVKSNASYALYLHSQNGALLNLQGGEQEKVGYTIQVGGRLHDLRQGSLEIIRHLNRAASINAAHTLEISIAEPKQIAAGTYFDILNVSAVALD